MAVHLGTIHEPTVEKKPEEVPNRLTGLQRIKNHYELAKAFAHRYPSLFTIGAVAFAAIAVAGGYTLVAGIGRCLRNRTTSSSPPPPRLDDKAWADPQKSDLPFRVDDDSLNGSPPPFLRRIVGPIFSPKFHIYTLEKDSSETDQEDLQLVGVPPTKPTRIIEWFGPLLDKKPYGYILTECRPFDDKVIRCHTQN